MKKKIISIIGGAGHVGFPLGLAFAAKGFNINFVDLNKNNLNKIKSGIPPFMEKGARFVLNSCLKKNRFEFSEDIKSIKTKKYIIVCIGTPVNKFLKPDLSNFFRLIKKLKKILSKNQILIIRSSVYPGVIEKIYKILHGVNNNIVYCPERIVQGLALEELPKLPQVIAGKKKSAVIECEKLFNKITGKIIKTNILEAELIKLFSNANRYINFAIANQLYMICDANGLNFAKIRKLMRVGYSRNLNLPLSGFTAGPCLLKDTMQLSSFYKDKFSLGIGAMKINESFPDLIVKKIKKIKDYKKKTVGVIGLSFKANSDDIRDSLAIKLLKKLKSNKIKFLATDNYFNNEQTSSLRKVLKNCKIIVLGAPHTAYKKIKFNNKHIIDVWGFFEKK